MRNLNGDCQELRRVGPVYHNLSHGRFPHGPVTYSEEGTTCSTEIIENNLTADALKRKILLGHLPLQEAPIVLPRAKAAILQP